MKILFLAAEAAPFSKVGGLGDVAGALPIALAALGHDVRVAIPFSDVIDRAKFRPIVVARFHVPHLSGGQTAAVSEVRRGGVIFYLVAGPPIPRAKRVYGTSIKEDGPKFIFFSLAALGLCRALEWVPDILHANDAHTGVAVYWLATEGAHDPFFQSTASVFTIHNLVYMHNHAAPYLRAYGFAPSDAPGLPDWARDSLMGLGLAHADVLNTVSPTHAREILTPEYGYGLEGVLRARRGRLSGILNGLDLNAWDPRRDENITTRFDAAHLARRAANKRALQLEMGLPPRPDAPLVGVVSRLVTQKGFDIAAPALREFLAGDAQLALLGTGLPRLEAEFKALARQFPDRARVVLRFDSALARRIYAGADLLLVPSLYEPCGLTQMIAMRYGAVPVVRRTGGLADTVTTDTGFVFRDYNSDALMRALRRAAAAYRRPARWRALQIRGMQQAAAHFSWSRSAKKYVALYQKALAYRRSVVRALRQMTSAARTR